MPPDAPKARDGLLPYFLLAWTITTLCGAPLALAWLRQGPVPAYAIPLAGLSALGPTLAALAVAWPRGELGQVFGRWRSWPGWIPLALLTPLAINSAGRLLALVLGSPASSWIIAPSTPEQIAALVMFSIGEEFGWRGFAHPRLAARFGEVRGSLLLGLGWALWHTVMLVNPETGVFEWSQGLVMLVMLPLYSVIYAWFMARGRGSMAVAIALHMGGHLDNIGRAPASELVFRGASLVVLAVAAGFAARSLMARGPNASPTA